MFSAGPRQAASAVFDESKTRCWWTEDKNRQDLGVAALLEGRLFVKMSGRVKGSESAARMSTSALFSILSGSVFA